MTTFPLSAAPDSSPTSSSSSPTNLATPSPTLGFSTLAAAHQQAAYAAAGLQLQQHQQQQQQKQTAVKNGSDASSGGRVKTAKSRKRVNTAEKRATHNAVERQRREALNGRFLDLARLLPSLAAVRRPSKSAIVNGSIGHLSLQRQKRLTAAVEIRALLAERDALLTEVNEWRARSGDNLAPRESFGVTKGVEDALKVDEEVFGEFTAGFGNDGDDDDLLEGDENDAASFDAAPSSANTNDNRSSFASSIQGNSTNFFVADETSSTAAAAAAIASSLNCHIGGPFYPTRPAMGISAVKTEALTPPSSDPQSPLSLTASGPTASHTGNGGLYGLDSDKVAQWTASQAASQLFQHLSQQSYEQQAHRFPMMQNPMTEGLLASISATQARASSFGGFPSTLATEEYGYQQQHDHAHQIDQMALWRQYALAHQAQQAQAQQPSLEELSNAVRAGISYSLGANWQEDFRA